MNLLRDGVAPKGRVELFVTTGGKPRLWAGELWRDVRGLKIYKTGDVEFDQCTVLEKQDIMNIVVGNGKDKMIEALTTGFINQIARMAIGDRGTIPSDPTVPKVPTATQTSLYNEVYRADVDQVVLDVGVTPGTHEVKFIKTFSAITIPITAYSNQANPVVNEVALIMADLFGGAPLPRADVAAPGIPDADETMFSIRTFKTVPFEAANEIDITVRYTIFIEG